MNHNQDISDKTTSNKYLFILKILAVKLILKPPPYGRVVVSCFHVVSGVPFWSHYLGIGGAQDEGTA